jgi:Cse1
MPRLVAKMSGSSSPETIIGVLKSANEIFKQFRGMNESHEMKVRLKAALDQFADPLTKFYQRVGQMAAASMQDKGKLVVCVSQNRICRPHIRFCVPPQKRQTIARNRHRVLL